jgi:hypothetical protein
MNPISLTILAIVGGLLVVGAQYLARTRSRTIPIRFPKGADPMPNSSGPQEWIIA